MGEIKGYATYHIFNDKNTNLIKRIIIEDNQYCFDFREDPSYMSWVYKNGSSTLMKQYKPDADEINKLKTDYIRAKELIIYAPDDDKAQNLNNLIHGGRLLAYPFVIQNPKPKIVSSLEQNFIIEDNYKQSEIIESMFFACLVASKSWSSKSLIYCVEKYRFSIQLDSFTPHSASPRFGQVFSIENRGFSYHVSAAYAFLSAYTIIEELGLEIRSSSKKPRFINKVEWNPVVKEDILNRLFDIGINESDTITWLIRGYPSELYNSIVPRLGIDSRWNDGEIIHDREMKIYDAIHYCSYIRNYFIAHKFQEVICHINPYDVHNVQMLARRLILEKLGLWNFDENEAEKFIR